MKVHFLTEKEYEVFVEKNEKYIFRSIRFSHSLTKSTSLLSQASVVSLGEYVYEVWVSENPVEISYEGGIRYAKAKDLIYARFEGSELTDLEETATALYLKIFKFQKEFGLHLVRIWNYIPNILDNERDLERYRQFNLGRYHAWVARGPKNEDGSFCLPAASGIGGLGGDLKIGVLFSKKKPVHIQNKNQVDACDYSKKYGPKPPLFSRATYLEKVGLFISGTASVTKEDSMYPNDPELQTHLTLENIQTLISKDNLKKYGLTDSYAFSDITDWRIYVKNIFQSNVIEKIFREKTGSSKKHIMLHDDICRKDLLVEIEGTILF